MEAQPTPIRQHKDPMNPHFEKLDCKRIHNAGSPAKPEIKDPKTGEILQVAEDAMVAWPTGFNVFCRPYMTGLDFVRMTQLTNLVVDPNLASIDPSGNYFNIMQGYASCALMIEYIDGNPFPGCEVYPEDPEDRVAYFQQMPTAVAVYIAREVGNLGNDPFLFLNRESATKSDSERASTPDLGHA